MYSQSVIYSQLRSHTKIIHNLQEDTHYYMLHQLRVDKLHQVDFNNAVQTAVNVNSPSDQ